MLGPTLCSDAEFTEEDMAILDNLMLEQEGAQIARDLGSPEIELIKDNCINIPTPPTASDNFHLHVVPSRYAPHPLWPL